jgi:hypothetical protein
VPLQARSSVCAFSAESALRYERSLVIGAAFQIDDVYLDPWKDR